MKPQREREADQARWLNGGLCGGILSNLPACTRNGFLITGGRLLVVQTSGKEIAAICHEIERALQLRGDPKMRSKRSRNSAGIQMEKFCWKITIANHPKVLIPRILRQEN